MAKKDELTDAEKAAAEKAAREQADKEATEKAAQEEASEVSKLSKKNEEFAKHMLQVQKGVGAVYVIDGLYFTDKKIAEARAFSTKGHIYTVTRDSE